jgi:hypothetical protein
MFLKSNSVMNSVSWRKVTKRYVHYKEKLIAGLIVISLTMTLVPITDSRPGPGDNGGVRIIINGMMGENGWYVSSVSITFIVNATHGWYRLFFKIDGGDWMEYTTPFQVSTDGYHTVVCYYIDQGGPSGEYAASFKIDKTAPTVIPTAQRIGLLKWRFTAEAFDATSSMNKVEFYVDSSYLGNDTEYPYIIIWSCSLITALRHYIYTLKYPFWAGLSVIAYDHAGNSVMPYPL